MRRFADDHVPDFITFVRAVWNGEGYRGEIDEAEIRCFVQKNRPYIATGEGS